MWLRFGAQLCLFVLLGLAVLLGSAALLLHGFGGALQLGRLGAREQLDIIKISLSVVAGVGGVIALTVAYRKQKLGEAAHGREEVKLFTERFGACVAQLGDDSPAVRLGGVYALVHLANDWETGRQTCIDVLCAQLRMPYPADQPDDPEIHAAFLSQREIRHTIWRLIGDHLRPGATRHPWDGHSFNFTGATIDGADLHGIVLTGGEVSFRGAQFTDRPTFFSDSNFCGAFVDFTEARFLGPKVDFSRCNFSSGLVEFSQSRFLGGEVTFHQAQFAGSDVVFADAKFFASTVDFVFAELTGSRVSFSDIEFSGEELDFSGATFTSGILDFPEATLSGGRVNFFEAKFVGADLRFLFTKFKNSEVSLLSAEFAAGSISFPHARFTGGEVNFQLANFSGSRVDFRKAEFREGIVNITLPRSYDVPPIFDHWTQQPKNLILPSGSNQDD